MFNYFSANKLICKNQLGVMPRDSCIHQLLSIIQEIITSFDNGLEVKSVFLDIAKVFNKVRHEGLFSNRSKTSFLVNFFASYLMF